MEKTLYDLGQILLQAIPTFFLVLLLWLYLNAMFFKPMGKVLADRRAATEGAREAAAVALQRSALKASEYEQAVLTARAGIHREQEQIRLQWREEQSARVAEARKRSGELVKQARQQLAGEAAAARENLESEARRLAGQITDNLLQGAAR